MKAGFLLSCYLLGIGYRDFKNVMISDDGEIVHFDFVYIMEKEPISIWLLGSQIKIFNTIVQPLLKDETNIRNPLNDEGYRNLMKECTRGFLALRSKILID